MRDLRALMADPALLLREGRVLARGAVEDVLTAERMSACFGRPIEVTRHAGRRPARADGQGQATTAYADGPAGSVGSGSQQGQSSGTPQIAEAVL